MITKTALLTYKSLPIVNICAHFNPTFFPSHKHLSMFINEELTETDVHYTSF